MDPLRFTDMQIDILWALSRRDDSFANAPLDDNLRRIELQVREQDCRTFETALRKVMDSLEEEMRYAKQEGNVERQTFIQQRYDAVEEYKRNFYSKGSSTSQVSRSSHYSSSPSNYSSSPSCSTSEFGNTIRPASTTPKTRLDSIETNNQEGHVESCGKGVTHSYESELLMILYVLIWIFAIIFYPLNLLYSLFYGGTTVLGGLINEELQISKRKAEVQKISKQRVNQSSSAIPPTPSVTQELASSKPISVPVPAVKQHTQEDRFNQGKSKNWKVGKQ